MCPICGRGMCDCSPFEKAASRPSIDLSTRRKCLICGRLQEDCMHGEPEQRKYAAKEWAREQNAAGYFLDIEEKGDIYTDAQGELHFGKSSIAKAYAEVRLRTNQTVVKHNTTTPRKFCVRDLALVNMPRQEATVKAFFGMGALGLVHAFKLLEDDGRFIPNEWEGYGLVFAGTLFKSSRGFGLEVYAPVLRSVRGQYLRSGEWTGDETYDWSWELSERTSLVESQKEKRRIVVWRRPKL